MKGYIQQMSQEKIEEDFPKVNLEIKEKAERFLDKMLKDAFYDEQGNEKEYLYLDKNSLLKILKDQKEDVETYNYNFKTDSLEDAIVNLSGGLFDEYVESSLEDQDKIDSKRDAEYMIEEIFIALEKYKEYAGIGTLGIIVRQFYSK